MRGCIGLFLFDVFQDLILDNVEVISTKVHAMSAWFFDDTIVFCCSEIGWDVMVV